MKNVFEYMRWKTQWDKRYKPSYGLHPLDGNDMVLAINAMQSKGDWKRFLENVAAKYFAVLGFAANDLFELFGNPAKFFELMERWLNEKV